MLEGFEVVNLTLGSPYISITKNGLTFNKASIVKLGKPAYVKLLMNKSDKMIAVQSCNDLDENATAFYKPKKSGLITVRWNNGELINTISRLMNWNLNKGGYRIDGDFLGDENAMVFDLKKAKNTSENED